MPGRAGVWHGRLWPSRAVSSPPFALFGQQILEYRGITVPALQGSGGLLLLLVALELLTGRAQTPVEVDDVNVALVRLGTPLIAGPGSDRGHDRVRAGRTRGARGRRHRRALRFSLALFGWLHLSGIQLVTRIFGLLLSAIAVQLVAESIRGFVAR